MTLKQKTLISWYRHDVINRTTFIYFWRKVLARRLMHLMGYVTPSADQIREKSALRHALNYKGTTK